MRLRTIAALLLAVALLSGCEPRERGGTGPGPLDRLSSAVTGVATARTAVLNGVRAVQAGATAVDATDAQAAAGHGVSARSSQRDSVAAVAAASSAVRNLPALVANYRASLTALDRNTTAVTGTAQAALKDVVRDGQAEAASASQFASVVRTAWQQYVSLQGQQKVWITRATSGWYRTDAEGGNAYAVLVGPGRRYVTIARTQLMQASTSVQTSSAVASGTLQAADKALDSVRRQR